MKRNLAAWAIMISVQLRVYCSRWGMSLFVSLLSLAVIGLLPCRLVAQTTRLDSGYRSRQPAAATQDAADQKDTPNPMGKAKRPDLATFSLGEFKVTVDGVRWVPDRDLPRDVDSGFPIAADQKVDQWEKRGGLAGGARGGSGSGASGGSSSGFGVGPPPPVLVVDLRVSKPKDDNKRLLCAVVGKVRAKDDRNKLIDFRELPVHDKHEVRGFHFPQGTERVAIPLRPKNTDIKNLRYLAGELFVADAKIQTTAFEGDELDKASTHQLDGATIRLEGVESTKSGIDLSASISLNSAKSSDPLLEMLNSGNGKRFHFALEDSTGTIHRSRGGSGGGMGHTRSYHIQFPPLPQGVTIKRILFTMTDLIDRPERVKFRFRNLAIPPSAQE